VRSIFQVRVAEPWSNAQTTRLRTVCRRLHYWEGRFYDRHHAEQGAWMRNGRNNNDRAWLPTYGVILLAVAALLITAALLIPAGD